jgi:pimeloyl-ACP methyl ester carboxylesterase
MLFMTALKTGYDLTIKANGVDLSYDDIGRGVVPIIFLHGFPFDKTMWQLQLEFLKLSNWVIALDIRGFGKSEDEDSQLSIELFSNDLIAFMDVLKISTAIVCGLSMGGFIALNSIARFPARFAALVLCDTQCLADTTKVKESRYKTIEQIQIEGVTRFNEGFIKSVFHENTLTTKKELVKNLNNIVFANSQRIICAGLTALAERTETCSMINKITVPTLIICGRQDVVTPLEGSITMHKNILSSTLHIIESAGHVSNLERPDEFNTTLHSFLMAFRGRLPGPVISNKILA